MQKELNPDLFGESKIVGGKSFDLEGQTALSVAMRADQRIVEVKEEIRDVRKQMNTVVERLASLVGQMNEYIKSNQIRHESLSKQLAKAEKNDQILAQEMADRAGQVQSKLGERRALDLKVHEMLDRHNGVLRTYDVRLNQLQKLISEKDAQVRLAMTALNDAKMEIARLKRL